MSVTPSSNERRRVGFDQSVSRVSRVHIPLLLSLYITTRILLRHCPNSGRSTLPRGLRALTSRCLPALLCFARFLTTRKRGTGTLASYLSARFRFVFSEGSSPPSLRPAWTCSCASNTNTYYVSADPYRSTFRIRIQLAIGGTLSFHFFRRYNNALIITGGGDNGAAAVALMNVEF